MRLGLIIILAGMVAPVCALAEAQEEESQWAGTAKLGYLATSGNTDNSTLNTGFQVSYTAGKWKHLAEALAINASENKVTTTEAYDLGWKSERNLSAHDFLFGRLQWRRDLFGAYAIQFSQSVGYGRRLISTDRHKLNVEIGVGLRQSELQIGATEDEAIVRGGAFYKWLFSENAEFRQDFSIEAGDLNTYLESVTALSAKLVNDLALVASYTIKHNTTVPPLTEKTDTYTALALEYTF